MHDKKYTTFLLFHEILHFMFQVTFFAVLNELTARGYNLHGFYRLSLQREAVLLMLSPNEAVLLMLSLIFQLMTRIWHLLILMKFLGAV